MMGTRRSRGTRGMRDEGDAGIMRVEKGGGGGEGCVKIKRKGTKLRTVLQDLNTLCCFL